MSSRSPRPTTAQLRVHLHRPSPADAPEFLEAVRASRRLHGAWVAPPSTRAAYRAWLDRLEGVEGLRNASFLARRDDDASLVGVFNVSEIVRGLFQSAYLGYYAFAPNARRGYMAEAFLLTLDATFRELALHRVEANVQPANERSVALVERAGFVREGYSRRYVKIAGRWRDHARYALLAEDWPRARRSLLATLQATR
jgi:ribosomal-protein-alanine N-acetyltransferase